MPVTNKAAENVSATAYLRPSFHRLRSLWMIAALLFGFVMASTFALAQDADAAAAGTWVGAIEIPGSPLDVQVTLSLDAGSWSGSIDIPAQGAVGIPLVPVTVDGAAVTFTIEGVPGAPTFTGEVSGDALTGTFVQGGQEFPFSLTRAAAAATGETGPPEDAQSSEYVDPEGRFTVQVPTGWTASDAGDYVRVAGPDGGLAIDLMVRPTSDPNAAIDAAWELIDTDAALEAVQQMEPPSEPGVDRTLLINYDVGDRNQIFQAMAQVVGDETYVMLVQAELGELQRRGAQLQIVATSFDITAVEAADLSSAQAQAVATIDQEFSTFVREAMATFSIPGASLAIVQGGEVVYLEGFGVTRAGSEEPVTPTTQMMIGSTGKTMTAMLVASLVDDGIIGWDTAVVDVLPSFAVADEELTPQITFRNLLCACTGVPRRDFELAFNYDELTAEAVIESLQGFEFFTDFGEAFQYSNQLVAAAGYAAAAATGASYGALQGGYRSALEQRVLAPIGMPNTTLDFGTVTARDEHATPHQLNVETGVYEPIDLSVEELLVPVGPAGVHWSTANDMARYLLTLLAGGVAPSGERVVSEQNLQVTWQPQVQISASESYGLGWIVSEYRGLDLLSHGGNTLGFTSEMLLVPSADLGIVLVANAQGANLFTTAVTSRLLELVYDQPAEAPAQMAFQAEQMEESLVEGREQLVDRVPLVDALSYMGAYTNPVLGVVSLHLEDSQLWLDVGEWSAQVRPRLNREGAFESFVLYGPPLTGLPLRFTTGEDDEVSFVVGDGLISYTFERLGRD